VADRRPGDYPEANAVVIFSIGHLEVKSENVLLDCHFRIKILTEAGWKKPAISR